MMIPWTELHRGEYRMTCPSCGRGERDKTLGVTIDSGAGVAHCFRLPCNYVETWRDSRAAIRQGSPAAAPVAPVALRKQERLSAHGLEIWNACVRLRGSIGAQNLLARHCAIPPTDGHLRYHGALQHPSGYRGPALVALVTHAETGQPMTLHRTWVKPDGTKADIDPPRMLLGGHRKQGGVIRLWPDEAVTYGLGIAEGIETALTLATVLKPAWSLIDAGNLAAFPVLPGIEVLTISVDHDEAGLAASNKCAMRWTEAGRDVRLVIPPRERTDLNDYARETA